MRATIIAGCLLFGCVNEQNLGFTKDGAVADAEPVAACLEFEGRTFASVELLGGFLYPDADGGFHEVWDHWTIKFATRDAEASDFFWIHGDVVSSGRVECSGESIVATDEFFESTIAVTFDPVTQVLSWDGELYSAAPEPVK